MNNEKSSPVFKRYWIYNDMKRRKAADLYIWAAGISISFAFKNDLKQLSDSQNCTFIVDWMHQAGIEFRGERKARRNRAKNNASTLLHLDHAELSRGPAVRSVSISLAVSFPPDTARQPRIWCSWMNGWPPTPRGLGISWAQLSFPITSSSVGARSPPSPVNPSPE